MAISLGAVGWSRTLPPAVGEASTVTVPFGSSASLRSVQPENALFPMDATLGMVTAVRPVQPLNAESPMEVTL